MFSALIIQFAVLDVAKFERGRSNWCLEPNENGVVDISNDTPSKLIHIFHSLSPPYSLGQYDSSFSYFHRITLFGYSLKSSFSFEEYM